MENFKIKENFPLISKVRQAVDFFDVKMPFKHTQPKNFFFKKTLLLNKF